MTEKKQERIVDKPSPEQVKQVLDKAKKVAKEPVQKNQKQAADKLDLVLNTLNKYTQKVDRIEDILSAKDTEQQKAQTQDKPTSEELLRQAEAEQEKTQGKKEKPGQHPGQPQQLTREQYQKLPDSQKVKILEQQLQTAQSQPGSPQSAWLLGKLIDNVSPVVTAALQSGKSNSSSVSSFFEGLKDYGHLENAFLNNFFRFFKFLSPTDQAKGAKNIVEQAAKLPEVQIPRDQGRIVE